MSQNRLSYFGSLKIQSRVIRSIMLRDMMMRYGRANIGFLWVVLEPILLTAGVMLFWTLSKSPYEHGVQVVAFVLTGYMPLTLYRHLSQSGVFIFRNSISFLYHRSVTFIDVLLARCLVEFIGTTAALFLVYGLLLVAGIIEPASNPGLALLAWMAMALLSFGLGAIFACITEYSETTERFIQPLQYLQVPISGAFFMLEWLPTNAQKALIYNPFIHCYEMFRDGFFGEAVVTHYDVWYPFLWGGILTFIGVMSIEFIRDHIETG